MPTEESCLKTKIRQRLTERGAFWSNVAGGAYSKPGDPDIVACYRGVYIAIEAKASRGRQSEVQMRRQEQISRAGGVYILIWDVSFVDDLLDSIDASIDDNRGLVV